MGNLHAQASVGIKGGITAATTSTANNLSANSPILGLQLGGVVSVPLSNGLGFQGELLLTQKGSRVVINNLNSIGSSSVYLEVPLLARLTLGPEDFPLYTVGGVYGGYWLTTINYVRQNGQRSSRTIAPDGSLNNLVDVGLALGVGYQQDMGAGKLNAEVRYDHGFIGLVKNAGGNQNRAIALSVAYLFDL